MVVLIVLARLLGPKEFGILGGALVVVGFAQIFSQLGIAPAIVQRPELNTKHVHVGFTLSFILSCMVGEFVILAAPAIAVFFRMPELKPVVTTLALVFPITGLSVVGQALLQREMQFKKIALIGIISYGFGYGLIGILFAYAGYGVWALVFAQLGQASIYSLIILLHRRESVGISIKLREVYQLLNYGFGFSLARIANYAATQIDNMVVGRFLGAEALGIYGRAYQFLMMPVAALGTVADKVFFPVMSSVQSDRIRLERAYRMLVSTIAMLALPTSFLLIILAPEIIAIILGDKWVNVVTPFQILASVLVFRTSYKMSDSLARATGAIYRRAWRQWVYALAILIGAWLGQNWGVNGVSVGVSVGITINFFLMLNLSLELVHCAWKDMLIIHVRHLSIALIVALSVLILKNVLIAIDIRNAFIILPFCIIFAIIVFMALAVLCRRLFGEEGPWIVTVAKNYKNLILKSSN